MAWADRWRCCAAALPRCCPAIEPQSAAMCLLSKHVGIASLGAAAHHRTISTSIPNHGKRNFRKFLIHNKRGSRIFKQQQQDDPDPDVPVYNYGVRPVGYKVNNRFHLIPEMVPQIIVPDVKDFKLKPYVSYKVADVVQSTFTAKDLFDAVYSKKIAEDLKNGKLDAHGNPSEPSAEESLTPEQAKTQARMTGSDIF